ncbi:MAG: hypothetical protein KC656_14215, partial [Myxococcales bacterium]|nr:hypothetical protein [Myxococcales bacterium]
GQGVRPGGVVVWGPRGSLVPLRSPDEPARHKALDLLGGLVGHRLSPRVREAQHTSERPGRRSRMISGRSTPWPRPSAPRTARAGRPSQLRDRARARQRLRVSRRRSRRRHDGVGRPAGRPGVRRSPRPWHRRTACRASCRRAPAGRTTGAPGCPRPRAGPAPSAA